MIIIPFLLTSVGCVVFGYGVQDSLSWVSLFFGYGLIAVALTAVRCQHGDYEDIWADEDVDSHHHFGIRKRLRATRQQRRTFAGERPQEHW